MTDRCQALKIAKFRCGMTGINRYWRRCDTPSIPSWSSGTSGCV